MIPEATSDLETGDDLLEFIGVGFGPSNLALAIAIIEDAPHLRGRFFEAKPSFQWHPGMLIDGARMQISFLKDLVSLRKPTSKFTFLNYLHEAGRLEHFVNLRQFFPTRVEFDDYLKWAASQVSDHVTYSTRVTGLRVSQRPGIVAHFEVDVLDCDSGARETVRTRNVVLAPGGTPKMLDGCIDESPLIVHSSDFLTSFVPTFPDRQRPHRFVVVGGGQSAAETALHLLREYENATVDLVVPHRALRPSDSSPFINQAFFGSARDEMFSLDEPLREEALNDLRPTNYGVVEESLLWELYHQDYLARLTRQRRLFIRMGMRLIQARDVNGDIQLQLRRVDGDDVCNIHADGVVLATGYRRGITGDILREIEPYFQKMPSGNIVVSRGYRVSLTRQMNGGLFVQGLSESTHGIGDSLLSQLPFRVEEILCQICSCKETYV